MNESRFAITSDYDNVNWKKVITVLVSFSHRLLFYQGLRGEELEKSAEDFAMTAILEYLDDKEKFVPSRNPDLILFLKYNILQRLIYNFGKSAKQLRNVCFVEEEYYNNLLNEFPFDEQIDVNDVVSKIKKEINGDVIMSTIFSARYEEGMKRSEICEEFEIPNNDYDNAMKRLRRVVEKHII